ncbi:hypothetical protein [Alkalicoccobacillus murimartini]|uniref:RNAse (Barnase) inhibitor barstar n=1 Tax=Alkalicoccobacillus murimartini TaxID=171685 RepID=A0ABT9YDN7_9BACI|nr:hypothetical protein [Alkalicoccobacillus murimartini]MDQ0205955.1 RNAse (barnase) inhibitor barstar [Alkalicoccobacillus murimartini]
MKKGKGGLQTADWYQQHKQCISLLSRQGDTTDTLWPVSIKQTEFPYSYFKSNSRSTADETS